MNVGAKKVVSIAYTLRGDDEKIIDTSAAGAPLVYLHGVGNLVPGLEKALEGKAVGDKLNVTLGPDDGYGRRDESLIRKVPVRKLPAGKVRVGARVPADMGGGLQRMVVITAVAGDYATVDPNHPLADTTLHFEVDVVAVRDATEEELTHGHAHAPGHEH